MKIIISSQGKEVSSLMDSRFGRCKYFCIYDTETKETKFVENEALNSSGGAGIQAANIVLKENADIVITGNLGPNASQVLENNKIKVFTVDIKTISDVINDYEQKR